MILYYGALIRNDIPESLLPEVNRRTEQIAKSYGLNKRLLMYMYGLRSLPTIVNYLFLKIVDLKLSIKLFGLPLFVLNRRNGIIRLALLGIPVYKSILVPYKKLND